jgi:hypothetical protein
MGIHTDGWHQEKHMPKTTTEPWCHQSRKNTIICHPSFSTWSIIWPHPTPITFPHCSQRELQNLSVLFFCLKLLLGYPLALGARSKCLTTPTMAWGVWLCPALFKSPLPTLCVYQTTFFYFFIHTAHTQIFKLSLCSPFAFCPLTPNKLKLTPWASGLIFQ